MVFIESCKFPFSMPHMLSSKHRIVPPVTGGYKLRLWENMAIEEENMMYLNRPYLTKVSCPSTNIFSFHSFKVQNPIK